VSGVRHAALVLHGLATADRQWLMSRLPVERQRELTFLLQELQDIGIPPDADLIRTAIGSEPPGRDAITPSPHGTLAAATAEQMHALLSGEPDGLVALVVGSTAWPWNEALLTRLGAQRAARVRGLALSSASGAMLRRTALEQLNRRLMLLPPTAPMHTPRSSESALSALKRRFLAWIR
jgi:hypothetical protein